MKPRYNFKILLSLVMSITVLLYFAKGTLNPTKENKNQNSTLTTKKTVTTKDLPKNAKSSDWDLILVNRDHPKDEMNPDITYVEGKPVDSRIAKHLQDFLASARKIDPMEHPISGYRSVSYQEGLFNSYVDMEMNQQGLSREEAIEEVQTYSQPPRKSEHQTGLAMDMSEIDSMNESKNWKDLAKIAPNYGFVLRFPQGTKDKTGIDFEDWHFRYVGIENAKYMTKNNLTLEEYVKLLKSNGR